MNLSHTYGDVFNTILKDEDGRAMYEIRTPTVLLGGGRTTILRISGWGVEEVAQIEWHYRTSTKFHFRDYTVEVSNYMPLRGFGRTKRVFVATDGHSYLWKMGWRGLKLVRDDGSKTHVAQYHPHTNVFTRQPSVLDITSHGLAILDEIVVTFVYMERKRKETETPVVAS
ncbi:hypothetical protein EWM64_g5416 [Hericium alpestre]|uniref:DUF6593 domain-containing protein n=1 Tax=Hericium alpestre TaxID=135208 RepID=A0A4Y9ZWR3_9AGAM|nr:hypothetical protein EWM64_g5416 [Hericium alpestre]